MPSVTALNQRSDRHCVWTTSRETNATGEGQSSSEHRKHIGQTYPRSRTNKASHTRSLVLSRRLPQADAGSTLGKPSICSALVESMHSALATLSKKPAGLIVGDGTTILFSERSKASVSAADKYAHVSSSAQCLAGVIQGMLTMKPKTISTDLYLL